MESIELPIGLDSYNESINKSTITYNNQLLVNSYKFKPFDILEEYNDRRNFSCIITSKRCTGKSVLLKSLCRAIKPWYKNAFVFSKTAKLQPGLFDYIPEENIYDSFNEEKLIEIWNKQEKIISESTSEDKPHVLLLFDDLVSDTKVKKSEILNRLFVAGRHLFFACFFITQTFTGVPPILRTNCDIAISFYLDSADNRISYSKAYLSTKNVQVGVGVFEKITKQKYQAIVVMNNKVSPNPEDYIRTYTASLKVPKFIIGSSGMSISKKRLTMNNYFVSPAQDSQFSISINIKSSNKTTVPGYLGNISKDSTNK